MTMIGDVNKNNVYGTIGNDWLEMQYVVPHGRRGGLWTILRQQSTMIIVEGIADKYFS